ncbi:MAG: hypothetical protein CM1200mP18_20770 [Gammaproteobacteria bacterium]|nr:MAG: hypothetical protein CM1200mP18_20770 [Gammaproteobacteria bacterium]
MALTGTSTVQGITQFGQEEWDTRVELAACYEFLITRLDRIYLQPHHAQISRTGKALPDKSFWPAL